MKRETEVFIYNDITDKSPLKLVQDLEQANGSDIKVRIHCYGGDVDAGFMMYNELRRYAVKYNAKVTTIAEGQCASIATVIFLAGDERIVNEMQSPFVHQAWGQVAGNANELMDAAFVMADATDKIAEHYSKHTNMTFEQALEFMNNDSFLSPELCLKLRFAHKIENIIKPLNKLNNQKMSKNRKGTFARLYNAIYGAKALLVKTASQDELDFYELEDGSEPKVGDKATVDGVPAGKYFEISEGKVELQDGRVYVFEGEELVEILGSKEELTEEEKEVLSEEAINKINSLNKEIKALKTKLAGYESVSNKFKGLDKQNLAGKKSNAVDMTSISAKLANQKRK